MSTPKERPILFKGEMVRVILDGRKTQTRRIMKAPPGMLINIDGGGHPFTQRWDEEEQINWRRDILCPYGQPGDRLWVREAFHAFVPMGKTRYYKSGLIKHERIHSTFHPAREVVYKESGEDITKPHPMNAVGKWKPSIHMPRWASRITLEITEVRVQRLQEITEEDAIAEGVDGPESESAKTVGWCVGPKAAYRFLWNSINGVDAWDANPYVWAISFKVVSPTPIAKGGEAASE